MILSQTDILAGIHSRDIIVKPFIEDFLGPSSYDLHLARTLLLFGTLEETRHDFKKHGRYELKANDFVLGATLELVGVPSGKYEGRIDGTSSLGRAGITSHVTASKLNPGHVLHLTMEIKNLSNSSVYLYWGMPIGQITFEELKTSINVANEIRSYGEFKWSDNPIPERSKLVEKTEFARTVLKREKCIIEK
jgi:deoxycytidine triphosphate deaminase